MHLGKSLCVNSLARAHELPVKNISYPLTLLRLEDGEPFHCALSRQLFFPPTAKDGENSSAVEDKPFIVLIENIHEFPIACEALIMHWMQWSAMNNSHFLIIATTLTVNKNFTNKSTSSTRISPAAFSFQMHLAMATHLTSQQRALLLQHMGLSAKESARHNEHCEGMEVAQLFLYTKKLLSHHNNGNSGGVDDCGNIKDVSTTLPTPRIKSKNVESVSPPMVAAFGAHTRRFESLLSHHKNILLHGPPGTGKTHLLRTIPTIHYTPNSQITSSRQGEMQSKLHRCFQGTSGKHPLFFDEFESLVGGEDDSEGMWAFIEEMDHHLHHQVIAATNLIGSIPRCIRNRFHELEVGPLAWAEQIKCLQHFGVKEGEWPAGDQPRTIADLMAIINDYTA